MFTEPGLFVNGLHEPNLKLRQQLSADRQKCEDDLAFKFIFSVKLRIKMYITSSIILLTCNSPSGDHLNEAVQHKTDKITFITRISALSLWINDFMST